MSENAGKGSSTAADRLIFEVQAGWTNGDNHEVTWKGRGDSARRHVLATMMEAATGVAAPFEPRPEIAAVLRDRLDDITTRFAAGDLTQTFDVNGLHCTLDANHPDGIVLIWRHASHPRSEAALVVETPHPQDRASIEELAEAICMTPAPVPVGADGAGGGAPIVASLPLPKLDLLVVVDDDRGVHEIDLPRPVWRQEPNPPVLGLAVAEARGLIECRTELVHRGEPWVTGVREANPVRCNLSDGTSMSFEGLTPALARGLSDSLLRGLTASQARKMAGSPTERDLQRPPCVVCGSQHP